MRYIDANGSSQTANGVNTVSGTSNSFSTGWYAVTSNVINKNRIICTGDVHLILCDGCKLTAPQGIAVNSGKANLTIYGQTGGTGELYIEKPAKYGYNAGIGGDSSIGSGVITINGGNITANGSDCGAAIGGSYLSDVHVTINDGVIHATGSETSAAIGGGMKNSGTVTIKGGNIIANGGKYSAAIGGGREGSGTVTIDGGEITATGGEIGAAIGGRTECSYAVVIHGGHVSATAVGKGNGIGSGFSKSEGTVSLSWTNRTDIITASSYSGAVTLAKTFHAGASNSKIGTVYESGAVSDNSTLTDKTIRPFYGFYPFLGHSISLNGDIGLNYYLNASAVNADLHFEWYNKTFDHTVTEADYDAASGCYKVQVNVAAAEMTCPIAATLTYAENDFVTDVYSVRDYADVILDSGSDFSKSYTAAYGAKKYDVLVDLIKKTLDYGTKAQTRFGVKDFKLANEDVKYTMQPITADHIKTQKTEMGDENLYKSGLNYIGTSVLFLSGTTLRHNYAVTDAYLLEQIKDTANFDFVNKGSRVCFERKNIPATQLDVDFVFTLGKSTYRYSVLDYCKLVIANESKSQTDRELAMATFWYNDAAKAYFYYSDEYDG